MLSIYCFMLLLLVSVVIPTSLAIGLFKWMKLCQIKPLATVSSFLIKFVLWARVVSLSWRKFWSFQSAFCIFCFTDSFLFRICMHQDPCLIWLDQLNSSVMKLWDSSKSMVIYFFSLILPYLKICSHPLLWTKYNETPKQIDKNRSKSPLPPNQCWESWI